MRAYSPHISLEAELITKIKSDKCDASFSKLYTLYYSKIVAHCVGIIGHRQDGEDAASTCFLKAYRNLKNLKKNESFPKWIYQIATYTCYDFIRKRNRKRTSQLPILLKEEQIVNISVQETKQPIRLDEIKLEIKKLNNLNKEIFILRYEDNLSLREISEIVSMSESAIKMRLLRIRKQLRKGLLK